MGGNEKVIAGLNVVADYDFRLFNSEFLSVSYLSVGATLLP